MIEIKNVSGGYSNEAILKNISFDVKNGEFFGIIGPNGSGKTTLLKMISGILPVITGEIALNHKSISSYSVRDFAKWIAVLPQHTAQTFSYTVKETVSLGRYAHQKKLFQSFSEEDERVVQEVMKQTGIYHYRDDLLDKLSGGERQRVYLAQSLAQNPKILLLDEPTNHLDLAYQKELLDLLKKWTLSNQLTVVSIFHDLNLASLYCDRLLLLHDGTMKICDYPDEVLKMERIQEVYETNIEKFPHPKIPKPQIMLIPEDQQTGQETATIDESYLQVTKEMIQLHFPVSLKTMSSGVTGSGMGWFRTFVNRHVGKDYQCSNHRQEMIDYLRSHNLDPNETVGMMTAVNLEDVSFQALEVNGCSLLIVVTAGTGNAVDAAYGEQHAFAVTPGTINTWVFVNGKLTDEAFIQCIMTATEAKTKALREASIQDTTTNTYATGTSTDSILIAATQRGPLYAFGGSITPLGSLVGKGVYACTKKSLHRYLERIHKP
ncbi:ABC transporter ATP-binding protein [Virgibacillus phasianinus]|uniref:ABC transporter ATP-binding protein n=1 Tax=Virgibacillus phasianinus TaxID=2017483 RepID=A0A220U160_9BACI|nr:adenosylcobinamide amidohydrolase [Virgibacillus phasianinus]ASK61857.1 ABC transporter ATP-binding protein [Virgibacillus phasianinus]